MTKHFENLWIESEQIEDNINSLEVIKELQYKLSLFESILSSNSQEVEKAKSHLMGEILFCLSKISAKENINVYLSLLETIKTRQQY